MERPIEPDANREIAGQPVEYILDKSFNSDGTVVIYKNVDAEPQIGRTVGIYHEDFGAEIVDVEQDPKRGYKITLKKIETR